MNEQMVLGKMLELNKLLREDKNLVLERIFDSMFDLVFIVDKQFNILQASPSIRTLGYTTTEVEFKSIFMLANDNQTLHKMFENPSNGHKVIEVVPLTNKKKELVYYEFFCTKMFVADNEFFITIATDVTARLTAEEELKKKNETIESQLIEERQFRLDQNKFSLQREITKWLVFLIGILIITPYVLNLFGAIPDQLTNGLLNVVLMLSGALVGAISGIFSTKGSDMNSNNTIEMKK